jgi:hypothetical protein
VILEQFISMFVIAYIDSDLTELDRFGTRLLYQPQYKAPCYPLCIIKQSLYLITSSSYPTLPGIQSKHSHQVIISLHKLIMSESQNTDQSVPYFPLASLANDGYNKDGEATATCYCGAVQLAFVCYLELLVSQKTNISGH